MNHWNVFNSYNPFIPFLYHVYKFQLRKRNRACIYMFHSITFLFYQIYGLFWLYEEFANTLKLFSNLRHRQASCIPIGSYKHSEKISLSCNEKRTTEK